jgi:hypothetical protein
MISVTAALVLALSPLGAGAAAGPATAKSKTASKPAPKESVGQVGPAAGTTSAVKKKGSSKSAQPRTRAVRPKATVAAGAHPINETVQVTPFPSHAAAAKKALSQNRRDQLEDAEKAARAEHQDDRWQTVLFHLREFDARSDGEACFWRVLSYYRLGEMARARTIRQLCTLGAKEQAVLDGEDASCGSLQPIAAMPEMLAAGEHPPEPVANQKAYAGAAPARLEQ